PDASALANQRRTSPKALRRALRGDLETIVMRAMHRDPERRYSSAEQLSEDLERHLCREPVMARPDTLGYRVNTLVRRHRAAVLAMVAILLALTAGLVGTTAQYRRAEVALTQAEWVAYTASLSAAEAALRADQPGEARRQLWGAPEHLRGWEWQHLLGRLDQSRVSLAPHERGITALAFNKAGTRLWSGSLDEHVVLYDVTSDRHLLKIGPLESSVESLVLTQDERFVIAGLGDGRVLMCSAENGSWSVLTKGDGWAQVAMHPSGERIAVGYFYGKVSLIEIPGGEEVGQVQTGGGLATPVYLKQGSELAVGNSSGVIEVYDAESLVKVSELRGHTKRIMQLSLSEDATILASCSMDQTVRVWDLPSGDLKMVFRGHQATVASVLLSEQEGLAISSGADRKLLRWDLHTGAVKGRINGHQADVFSLARSGDGATLAAGGWDGRILLFDWLAAEVPTHFVRAPSLQRPRVTALEIDPFGRWITCVSELGDLVKLNPEDLTPMAYASVPYARELSTAPSGDWLAVAVQPSGIEIVNPETMTISDTWKGFDALKLAAFEDGVLIACADDSLRLLSRSGEILRAREIASVTSLTMSRDGKRVVVGQGDGSLSLLRTTTLVDHWKQPIHTGRVNDVAVDSSNRWIASVGEEGAALVVDLETGEIKRRFDNLTTAGGTPSLLAVSFLAGGERVAIGGADQIVRLLETRTGREVLRLNGHVGRILKIAENPVQGSLVTGSLDGSIRSWGLPSDLP
ncbi:MAG: hypothetical protein HKN21_08260, partial [Candidatus Eisenbacteria bacterium]|nr:hypothetical protein [Candidatus Eisenbacteria bacterium]